ncbi:MAG TPA: hypothetical protein VFX59_13630 [Polyangiales bacterium]|nr:hypothetical protein [Polyangiales bacterium]
MAFRAPLLGYNTNVRHKGKLYHIQTEDSGIDHPHVITHLFADGGRIVASKKTSYAERVGSEGLPDQVKKLMQGQHKAMFIALRDGAYDEDGSDNSAVVEKVDGAQVAEVAAPVAEAAAPPPTPARPARPARSLFGGELLGDKTLDEVILNYLAANEPNESNR